LRGLGSAPNDRDASADNHVPRTHSTRRRTAPPVARRIR
jgi:hypothetical protein